MVKYREPSKDRDSDQTRAENVPFEDMYGNPSQTHNGTARDFLHLAKRSSQNHRIGAVTEFLAGLTRCREHTPGRLRSLHPRGA